MAQVVQHKDKLIEALATELFGAKPGALESLVAVLVGSGEIPPADVGEPAPMPDTLPELPQQRMPGLRKTSLPLSEILAKRRTEPTQEPVTSTPEAISPHDPPKPSWAEVWRRTGQGK